MELRVENLALRFDFAPNATPSPGVAAAKRTPEGYLVLDALLARDGTLQYSDGRRTWTEFRPRSALEAAAETWVHRPLTDGHPKAMVDSKTWGDVAKGHVMEVEVLEPDSAGVTFLRGKVLVADDALIDRIEDGKREVSIGFLARTLVGDGVSPQGTPFQATQAEMHGNHLAVVDRGRAGPKVRLMLDSGECTVLVPTAMSDTKNILDFRTDQMGMAEGMGTAIGPDGQEIQAPMWLLELAKLGMEAQKTMGEPPAADPMIDLSAPVQEPPKAPAAPAAPEQDRGFPMAEPKEERKESATAPTVKPLDYRAIRRLERLATRVGVSEEKLDAADDEASIAREILAVIAPNLDTEHMDEAALATAVSVAQSMGGTAQPKAQPKNDRADSPWVNLPDRTQPAAEAQADPHILRLAKMLKEEAS